MMLNTWVIGYGNLHRTDDGIGPFVADLVEKSLTHGRGVCVRILDQLAPDLIEDLQHAGIIIFVDATMDIVENGWKWVEIDPDQSRFYHVTHLFTPEMLLSLMISLYGKKPEAYLVSVQGDRFEFGEGLDLGAQERSLKAASAIIEFLDIRHGPAETACNPNIEGGYDDRQ